MKFKQIGEIIELVCLKLLTNNYQLKLNFEIIYSSVFKFDIESWRSFLYENSGSANEE